MRLIEATKDLRELTDYLEKKAIAPRLFEKETACW